MNKKGHSAARQEWEAVAARWWKKEERAHVVSEKEERGSIVVIQYTNAFFFQLVISTIWFHFATCHTSMHLTGINGGILNGAKSLFLGMTIKEYSLIEYQLFYITRALQKFPENKRSKKLQNQFKATHLHDVSHSWSMSIFSQLRVPIDYIFFENLK